jgi:hypothetical protein
LIAAAILVDKSGSKKNMEIAAKVKNIINGFLSNNFTNYTGELIEESANIIKLYASGKDSCIFGIFAFAVCLL